jgi:alpha-D-xyloside xylohydrolase
MKRLTSSLTTGIITIALTALFFQSCSNGSHERTEDGVLIRLSDKSGYPGQAIRLQVISEKIIRVTSVPSGAFPETLSLMALPLPGRKVEFTVEKADGSIILGTSQLSAEVSLKTGMVTFTDKDGKVMLQRRAAAGKHLLPLPSVEKTATISVSSLRQQMMKRFMGWAPTRPHT